MSVADAYLVERRALVEDTERCAPLCRHHAIPDPGQEPLQQ
jgi:hypothetical protein